MNFIQKVREYIQDQHLLTSTKELYLVALSGGADSVALLLSLRALGYQVEACHCNFHLRGEESNRDEQFCVKLCERLAIPLHRIHFDTRSYATLHKESIELAARNLRYRYFEQLRQDMNAEGICVAHHRDDSVETVLINLVRGTGINGLTGISSRNGNILRPLLCVNKEEILAYLEEKNESYITDSSNLVDDVVRNKIRLRILPLLKTINPSVFDNIAKTARHLKEASKVIDAHFEETIHIDQMASVIKIDKGQLVKQASQEYALFHCLSPYGFSGRVIAEIQKSLEAVGKTWYSATHQLIIDRRELLLQPINIPIIRPIKLPEEGTYVWGEGNKIRAKIIEKEHNFVPSKDKYTVTLDADKLSFPLTLRLTRNGDRFHPFGMKGSKLVSDYLTDHKRNLFEKQEQLVVEDANEEIVWLVGERTSERCRVNDATQRILTLYIFRI